MRRSCFVRPFFFFFPFLFFSLFFEDFFDVASTALALAWVGSTNCGPEDEEVGLRGVGVLVGGRVGQEPAQKKVGITA